MNVLNSSPGGADSTPASSDQQPDISHERKIIAIFGLFGILIFGGLLGVVKLATLSGDAEGAPAPTVSLENASIAAADHARVAIPAPAIANADPRYDLDRNGKLDNADVAMLAERFAQPLDDLRFDLTGDGHIDHQDIRFLRAELATRPATLSDLDRDGYFDNRDIALAAHAILGSQYAPYMDLDGSGMVDVSDLHTMRATLSGASSTVYFDLSLDGRADNHDVKIVTDAINSMSYSAYADMDVSGNLDALDLSLIRAFLWRNPEIMLDLTLDGRVDNFDVELLANAMSSMSYDAYFDIDASGQVEVLDLMQIRTALAPKTDILYDLNKDGVVTNDDLRLVATALLSPSYSPYADLDASGQVEVRDLTLIRAAIQMRGDTYVADLDVNGNINRFDREIVERAAKNPSYQPEADLDGSGRVDKADLATFDLLAPQVRAGN
ncbi:MAG TPA: hypothetical protein VLB83_05865 [Candidatus Paceibacterota bacterium]|nr:hypothetical protein [Candidatus Paceibacterota bacterium]